MRKIRERIPSPAMIVACVALTVALSGAGYAAVTLPRNSVGTVQLKKFAVTAKKIKPGNVTRGEDHRQRSQRRQGRGRHAPLGGHRQWIADGRRPHSDRAGWVLCAVSAASGCTADEGVLTTCASASLTLPRAGKVLLNATGEWHTFALDDTLGPTRLGTIRRCERHMQPGCGRHQRSGRPRPWVRTNPPPPPAITRSQRGEPWRSRP